MSTVGPTNVPAFFNADSDFRSWGSTISAALATLGLVQTADTGQINWSTVSKPAATNTSQGYEIWRFNDSLQSSVPVYLKVEYGSGGANDRPSMWLTVGSGSNGSGTLTGQTDTRSQVQSSASKTAGTNLPFYASGNSGELQLAVNIDTSLTTFGILLSVERTKDSSDNTTNDGVLVTRSTASTFPSSQYVPATGSVPASQNSAWGGIAPALWARSGAGANADACPVFIPLGGVWRYSHMLMLGAGDWTAGGTLTMTILGGTHTYMSLNQSCGNNATSHAIASGYAIRWE